MREHTPNSYNTTPLRAQPVLQVSRLLLRNADLSAINAELRVCNPSHVSINMRISGQILTNVSNHVRLLEQVCPTSPMKEIQYIEGNGLKSPKLPTLSSPTLRLWGERSWLRKLEILSYSAQCSKFEHEADARACEKKIFKHPKLVN